MLGMILNVHGELAVSIIIPPGFAQASFVHTSNEGTEPFVCTLGLSVSEYGGDYVEAANVAFDHWASEIVSIMDSDLTFTRVSLLIGADGPSGSVDSTEAPVVGGRSAAGLPWSLSAIATKRTADLGRRGRGRMFIPGVVSPSEVGQSGNIDNTRRATILSALEDFYDLLVTDAEQIPIPPYLLHSPGPGSTAPTPISGFGLAPLVGWVRKRIR
jgi:hypothetical protein